MGLSLKTFGAFSLRDERGTEVSLRTRKTRALLAYLAINADRPQPRERLMGLLWSDHGEQQARQNLNDALKSIRRLSKDSAPALIDSDREQVTLHSDALESDVARFNALAEAQPDAAAALYEGPFLDGLSVPDPTFEDWLRVTRSGFEERTCEALGRAADDAAAAGNLPTAINLARRLLALDPLREEAHRHLMKLLYRNGDRPAALLQYRICSDLLENELQIGPDTATKALFDEIRQESSPMPTEEPSSFSSSEQTPLSDKPSIAVLPFVNMGGDPDEEFLVEGMAEDITIQLSHIRWLLVIARSSTLAYKNQRTDVRQIGTDLGVRYVLEGSIRRNKDRIRVTVQLLDATTGSNVWAESYDRGVVDIFQIQDEIANSLVGALGPQIDRTERIRARQMPPERLDAWTQYQLAMGEYHAGTSENLKNAIRMFDQAAEMDPTFARAYAMGGASRNRMVINHGVQDGERYLAEAVRKLTIAVDLDPQDATCHSIFGIWYSLSGEIELSLQSLARAVELSPSSAEAHFFRGTVLRRAGHPDKALACADRALRLSPNDSRLAGFLLLYSSCLFDLERYEECAAWSRRAIHSPNPRATAFINLAAALFYLSRAEDAGAALDALKARFPNFTFRSYLRTRRGHQAIGHERYLNALRALGFSD